MISEASIDEQDVKSTPGNLHAGYASFCTAVIRHARLLAVPPSFLVKTHDMLLCFTLLTVMILPCS